MKTTLILSFLFSAATLATAQTGTKSTTVTTTTTTTTKVKIAEKDLIMCDKNWQIVSMEEWGVVSKPGDKNKGDMLKLNSDGTFQLILFGTPRSGTWQKTGQYIYFSDEKTKEKFNYKVLNAEATKLKIDYRDPDETHTIFEYTVK
jgi:hypothetical protein